MDTVSNYTETLEKTVRDLLERQEDLIRTAFTDQLTGLGNRGGFARSLEELWEQDTPVTMAFIDIDNLKHCNDVFGHDEGNRYILQVSLYLKLYMKVDEAAFRIGGDEFAILSTIATEDDLAERLEHCRTILLKNNDSEMPHSFSYGVAHADPALGEASNRMTLDADHRMYDYKLRHAMHLDRRNITQVHADDFEISDRIFDAFSMLNEGRYFFIENLDKDRTLWSQGALRDLGLPSEHIDSCRDFWKTRVHPDDLEAYANDINQIFNGSKHRRVMQYRMRNAAGDYVLCRARGFRIDGDGNAPSLYVGELVNHSLAETVDAATGLGTQRMLINAIDACRRDRCETGLIAVRVRGTTKLNELYGAEAVDNMLAEYAGRMLSITRGRSRVYRSRSVQFVVLSNDLDHEAFEQLTRHLKEAVFRSCSNRRRRHYSRLSCRIGLLRALNPSSDRRFRRTRPSPSHGWRACSQRQPPHTRGGAQKRHRRTYRLAHGTLSTQRVYAARQRISRGKARRHLVHRHGRHGPHAPV